MTTNQFLNYISWGINDKYRPHYISKGRWAGMIKWYYVRSVEIQYKKEGECT